MNASIDHILHAAADRIDAGQAVALCALVDTKGSTPAAAGAVMLVDDGADTLGTIGGGCVEAEVRRQVLGMLTDGRSGRLSFQLNHDFGWDDGLICGGRITVAVWLPTDAAELRAIANAHRRREPASIEFTVAGEAPDDPPHRYTIDLPPRPHLLIAGAGHVGQALARLALDLEFAVTAFDDRADLLDRFMPEGVTKVAGPIAGNLAERSLDDQSYVVVVTRGHRHDEEALHAVITKPARYLGMIGSRRKVKLIFDDLRELGVSDEDIDRVHAPIGVEIGSVTVNEIALSIAAQLVAVRRADHRSPVRASTAAAPAASSSA
ncbi:MAG: XdhC family protein [Phycisphaerales bacterium]